MRFLITSSLELECIAIPAQRSSSQVSTPRLYRCNSLGKLLIRTGCFLVRVTATKKIKIVIYSFLYAFWSNKSFDLIESLRLGIFHFIYV